MHYFAAIDRRSAIHRQWTSSSRISGELDGVLFRWNSDKKCYEARELTPDQVAVFNNRPDKAVILETLRVLPETEPQQNALTDRQEVEQQAHLPDTQQGVAPAQQARRSGKPRRRQLQE